jgi:hypothetical protein
MLNDDALLIALLLASHRSKLVRVYALAHSSMSFPCNASKVPSLGYVTLHGCPAV